MLVVVVIAVVAAAAAVSVIVEQMAMIMKKKKVDKQWLKTNKLHQINQRMKEKSKKCFTLRRTQHILQWLYWRPTYI